VTAPDTRRFYALGGFDGSFLAGNLSLDRRDVSRDRFELLLEGQSFAVTFLEHEQFFQTDSNHVAATVPP
jgi:hypothetical protein